MDTTNIGDAIEVAPDLHEALLENERVRVLEYRMRPGESAETHTHPDHVVYHLEGVFTARSTSPDGEVHEFEVRPDMCLWSPASAHVFESIDGEPARGLIIELR